MTLVTWPHQSQSDDTKIMSASAHAPIYISIIMWAAQGWSDPERIMSQSCDVVFYEQPFKEPRRIVSSQTLKSSLRSQDTQINGSGPRTTKPESLDPGLVRVHRSCCSFFLFFSFLQQTVSEINTFRVTGVELLLLLCSSVL